MQRLRDAWCVVVKAYGVGRLAEQLAVNADTLQSKCVPHSTSHRPSLEDFENAAMFTGDTRLADPLCQLLGGVFVKTMQFEGVSDVELLDAMNALVKEFGDVGPALSAALADGRIDQGDLDRVQQQLYELNQRGAQLYARLVGMKRETKLRVVKP